MPAGGQLVVHGQFRFAGGIGTVGGAQHRMTTGDLIDGIMQSLLVQMTGDGERHTDIEQCVGRLGGLQEPHPALAVGQLGFRRRGRLVLGLQAALGELATQQLQPGIVPVCSSRAQVNPDVDLGHASFPPFLICRIAGPPGRYR